MSPDEDETYPDQFDIESDDWPRNHLGTFYGRLADLVVGNEQRVLLPQGVRPQVISLCMAHFDALVEVEPALREPFVLSLRFAARALTSNDIDNALLDGIKEFGEDALQERFDLTDHQTVLITTAMAFTQEVMLGELFQVKESTLRARKMLRLAEEMGLVESPLEAALKKAMRDAGIGPDSLS